MSSKDKSARKRKSTRTNGQSSSSSSSSRDKNSNNESGGESMPPELAQYKFMQSVQMGDLKRCMELLENTRVDVNAMDYDKRTALHVAAAEGHVDIVTLLLTKGANANPKDRWGKTPLEDAFFFKRDNVTLLLRSHGAILSLEASDGAKHLCDAAKRNDCDLLKRLAVCGVNVNEADYDARTALHVAASEGNLEAVKVLLLLGAEPHLKDRWGSTPFVEAEKSGHQPVASFLSYYSGNPSSSSSSSSTPLSPSSSSSSSSSSSPASSSSSSSSRSSSRRKYGRSSSSGAGITSKNRDQIRASGGEGMALSPVLSTPRPSLLGTPNHSPYSPYASPASPSALSRSSPASPPLSVITPTPPRPFVTQLSAPLPIPTPPRLCLDAINPPPSSPRSPRSPDRTSASILATSFEENSDVRIKEAGSSNESPEDLSHQSEIQHADLVFEREISHGSFGVVSIGTWKGQEVAIKEIRTSSPDDENQKIMILQLRREIATLNRVQHPNIVRLIGAAFDPPKVALVTEFIHGSTLLTYMKEYSKEPRERVELLTHAIGIALQIARGMAHSHRLQIIHRDLKSPNIMVEEATGRIVIIDFGSARIVHSSDSHMTKGVGSFRWIAPELFVSSVYNEKVDIYSFAIILWELLHPGQIPLAHYTPIEAAYAVAQRKVRPQVSIPLSTAFAKLLRACWNQDPKNRPSFATIIDILENQTGKLLKAPKTGILSKFK